MAESERDSGGLRGVEGVSADVSNFRHLRVFRLGCFACLQGFSISRSRGSGVPWRHPPRRRAAPTPRPVLVQIGARRQQLSAFVVQTHGRRLRNDLRPFRALACVLARRAGHIAWRLEGGRVQIMPRRVHGLRETPDISTPGRPRGLVGLAASCISARHPVRTKLRPNSFPGGPVSTPFLGLDPPFSDEF